MFLVALAAASPSSFVACEAGDASACVDFVAAAARSWVASEAPREDELRFVRWHRLPETIQRPRCNQDDLEACRERCREGQSDACEVWAAQPPADLTAHPPALAATQAACDVGLDAACETLASLGLTGFDLLPLGRRAHFGADGLIDIDYERAWLQRAGTERLQLPPIAVQSAGREWVPVRVADDTWLLRVELDVLAGGPLGMPFVFWGHPNGAMERAPSWDVCAATTDGSGEQLVLAMGRGCNRLVWYPLYGGQPLAEHTLAERVQLLAPGAGTGEVVAGSATVVQSYGLEGPVRWAHEPSARFMVERLVSSQEMQYEGERRVGYLQDFDVDGVVDLRVEFGFDALDRVVEERTDIGLDGTVDSLTTFVWEDGFAVEASDDYDLDGQPDVEHAWTYEDGLLVAEEHNHLDEPEFQRWHTYTHDDAGRPLEQQTGTIGSPEVVLETAYTWDCP